MRRLLLFLSLVLAAGQARAAAPFDVAHATTIGGSDAIALLRFTTISPVLLGNQDRRSVVIVLDPRGTTGQPPDPRFFTPTLDGCFPGPIDTCCQPTTRTRWILTDLGWIDTRKQCALNLAQDTAEPITIGPPLAELVASVGGLTDDLVTTASVDEEDRLLTLHKRKGTKVVCGKPRFCHSTLASPPKLQCSGANAPAHLWASVLPCSQDGDIPWRFTPDKCSCN